MVVRVVAASRYGKVVPDGAFYAAGHHLLTRDHQGPVVMADILAFLRDPQGPLPSGAPPIPTAPPPLASSQRAAGL